MEEQPLKVMKWIAQSVTRENNAQRARTNQLGGRYVREII